MLAATAQPTTTAYAGEITPTECYSRLCAEEKSWLVDVRTLPEWQFVGVPDLADAKGKLACIAWKTYPNFSLNPHFAAQLAEAGISKNDPIFFLCRSGGRSLDAAIAMTAQGYTQCYNVTDGFEGEPDAKRHRAQTAGWQAAGLPWCQQ